MADVNETVEAKTAFNAVEFVHKMGRRILNNIIQENACQLAFYIDTAVKETGGTPESALEYLGAILPEFLEKIKKEGA